MLAEEYPQPAESFVRHESASLLHGGANVIVVALFAFAWWLRSTGPDPAPTTNVFLIQVVALVLGSIAGWLGGELVDRLGVGVDDGAHLDAASSLSGRPARSSDSLPAAQRRRAS
jgi:uncharacterized membrane protein